MCYKTGLSADCQKFDIAYHFNTTPTLIYNWCGNATAKNGRALENQRFVPQASIDERLQQARSAFDNQLVDLRVVQPLH